MELLLKILKLLINIVLIGIIFYLKKNFGNRILFKVIYINDFVVLLISQMTKLFSTTYNIYNELHNANHDVICF